ncbi:Uncharacterised protein [uncultured archaeon]|nr:Uncharacterised protein [uncultured archaeon]
MQSFALNFVDRKNRNDQILGAIRKQEPLLDETHRLAGQLVAERRYYVAAFLLAQNGMKDKALAVADKALKDDREAKFHKRYSDAPEKLHALVEIAEIYAAFDERHGKGRAAALAQECEVIVNHISFSSHQENYAATAGMLFSIAENHLEASIMFEKALENIEARDSPADWEKKLAYLKWAAHAYRNMGNVHHAERLGTIMNGEICAIFETHSGARMLVPALEPSVIDWGIRLQRIREAAKVYCSMGKTRQCGAMKQIANEMIEAPSEP